ncbi:DNA-binding protein WhiA, partial [Desulfosporosinus sp. SYSU MS00001]|uniref:DNA-binding protein WhiA n=1 Tax=Desulfosporosinus sp. SYSU MS00001 TaxID=3416284 RepID=UPI003CEED2FF
MSFSSKVKSEVCRITNIKEEEARAILSAIMKVSGTLSLGGNKQLSFRITTENPSIARYIFRMLKEKFAIHTKIFVKKNNSFKKSNIYMIVITEDMGARSLLANVGVLKETEGVFSLDYGISKELISNEECRRAYIRGAFLGGGSISNPEKTYHLEFVTHNND